MRFTVLIALSGMSLVCGCASKVTTILTDPAAATLRVAGYGECETPCTIALTDSTVATVAKAGYRSKEVALRKGRRKIVIDLELAAPSEAVESDRLPDL